VNEKLSPVVIVMCASALLVSLLNVELMDEME